MAVNKVEYCGKVLLDLTEDSVTPENLVEGVTAHGKNGEKLVGTNPYAKAETDAVVNEQTDLIEQIMAAVDNLPEAGGVELPELDNPASADDIVEGKEAISELGEVVVGTNPYAKAETDMVVDEQTDLIAQIRDAVDGLPEAGGGAIESCTITINGMSPVEPTFYYTDATTMMLNSITTVSGTLIVPKNTIVAITDWSAMCSGSGGCTEIFYLMGNAVYQITDDCIFNIHG